MILFVFPVILPSKHFSRKSFPAGMGLFPHCVSYPLSQLLFLMKNEDSPSIHNNEQSHPPVDVIPNGLSQKLRSLSFISASFVVLLHARTDVLPCSKSANWIMTFFSMVIASFAVLLFFSISGYLIAKKTDCGLIHGWYRNTITKKVLTLGIPYLAWCTVYAVTFLPFTLLGNHLAGRELLHSTYLHEPLFSMSNIGRIYGFDLFGFPAAGIMWYVRNLFLLFLLLPLIFPILRHRTSGLLFLVVSGGLFFCHDFIQR